MPFSVNVLENSKLISSSPNTTPNLPYSVSKYFKSPSLVLFLFIAITLSASAAENFKGRITAVILTGMGRDASAGALKIKEKGGFVIAQDKDTSVIYGMPKAVVEKNAADKVLPLDEIAGAIAGDVEKHAEAV